MTISGLVIRVEDRSTAVERVLGRLRARLRGTPHVSLGNEGEGVLQLVVTLEAEVGSRHQLKAELRELRDVRSVDDLPPAPAVAGHEMALVRLRREEAPPGSGTGGPPDVPEEDRLVMITGTGEEVDRILASLRESGVLAAAARTGALAPPARAGPDRA